MAWLSILLTRYPSVDPYRKNNIFTSFFVKKKPHTECPNIEKHLKKTSFGPNILIYEQTTHENTEENQGIRGKY